MTTQTQITNKAQHSPFPRLTESEAKENMTGAYITLADGRTQYCEHLSERERRAVNHADKLAEALRDCLTDDGATAFVRPKYAPQRLRAINEIVTAVLATYEAAQ